MYTIHTEINLKIIVQFLVLRNTTIRTGKNKLATKNKITSTFDILMSLTVLLIGNIFKYKKKNKTLCQKQIYITDILF